MNKDAADHYHELELVNKGDTSGLAFASFISDLWKSRGLLAALIQKEIIIRYRGSFLGFAWTLIQPLIQLAVYGLVIGVFLGNSKGIPNYPLYLFLGIMMWGLFSETVVRGTSSIQTNAPLVKKIYFRREMLPLSVAGVAVVNLVFSLVVVLISYLYTNSWPEAANLPYVIPALLLILLPGIGLGLLLSALNVFAKDVLFIVEVAIMLLFWVVPVLYPVELALAGLDKIGAPAWASTIYLHNPLTMGIICWREALMPVNGAENAASSVMSQSDVLSSWHSPQLFISIVISLGFVWVSQRIFNRLQRTFAAQL